MSTMIDRSWIDPFLICLAVSLIWAPLVYLGAKVAANKFSAGSGAIWKTALVLAIVPSLSAPLLSQGGVSLRPTQVVLPQIAAPIEENDKSALTVPAGEPEAMIDPTFTKRKAGDAIALIYGYGLALAFGIWLFRVLATQASLARARETKDANLLDDINVWTKRFGLNTPPRVFLSPDVSSVCMVGFLRPCIMLPEKIDQVLSRDELAVMCAHELAHIKRRDGALFLVLALVRVLFWFNPAIPRLTARVEQSAEECADALVVNKGADRKVYANCFVEALKFAAARPRLQPAYAPSFTPIDREGRRKRLERILGEGSGSSITPTGKALLGAFAVGVGCLAIAQAAYAVAPETRLATLDRAPLSGKITVEFGKSKNGKKFHQGIDIRAPQWSKIVAPADAEVIESTDLYNGDPYWGKVIVLDHGSGLVTRYAHLGKCLVQPGDKVKAGDLIAKVGSTGKSSGPHLHFEVIKNGDFIDPRTVIDGMDAYAKKADENYPAPSPGKPLPIADPEPAEKPERAKKYKKHAKADKVKKAKIGQSAIVSSEYSSFTSEDPEILLGGDAFTFNHHLEDEDQATAFLHKQDWEVHRKDIELAMRDAQREIERARIESEREIREAKREAYRAEREALREAKEARTVAIFEQKRAIKEQERAIKEALKDLDDAKKDGAIGLEDAYKSLKESEKALKKARRALEKVEHDGR